LTQPQYENQLALVIATKDRPDNVQRLLSNISQQSVRPHQVIIVDGGEQTALGVVEIHPDLEIDYITVSPPGLTKQKNAGVAATKSDMDLIAFFDDDMVFEDGAMEAMMKFWETAPEEVAGASFNLPDFNNSNEWLKSLVQRLFFIDNRGLGRVLRSGFNTPIWNVPDNIDVQWLGGGYTVWRKRIFENWRFEEWFTGSGMWEDTFFSYRVGRQNKLAIVANARAAHMDAPVFVEDQFRLGRTQIVNWMYFVGQNQDLSMPMCLWACAGRTATNLAKGVAGRNRGYLLRALGNTIGIMVGAAGAFRSGQPDSAPRLSK
jgi:glycosyltransferase involved in cell wall biosynthesis